MKFFGDDGFRDIYGVNFLSRNFLDLFFNNLNFLLQNKKIKKIIIGYDNRTSNKNIIDIILKNIKNIRKILVLKTPISTPGLQYLSKKEKCFGIMITASHFPAKYNGFKFFVCGSKLTKNDEVFLEKKISLKKKYIFKNIRRQKIEKINEKKYIDFLNINSSFEFKKKILIDGSNGSVSFFKKKLKLFENSKLINFDKNGKKINKNCGSNYFEGNIKKKIFKKYDFSIAYDGDADRFLVAEKKYGLIEAEKIALIFVNYFSNFKKIKNIVMTEIANPWLSEELKVLGIRSIISKVGDRNVVDKVKKYNSFLGFETSGHFSFFNSMDGILASIFFCRIINARSNLIYDILKKKIIYKKAIFGILTKNVIEIKNYISKKEIKYIIRKSIWNNYYKLYVFYKKEDLSELKKLKKYLFDKSLKIKIKN